MLVEEWDAQSDHQEHHQALSALSLAFESLLRSNCSLVERLAAWWWAGETVI